MRVGVAMSGGVDSSVAAYLCVQKYGSENVFGVSLKLINGKSKEILDAKAVCKKLKIKHYSIDARDYFEKEIINSFVDDYRNSKTPNPCINCNNKIKFGYLLDRIKELGGNKLATGHYASIVNKKINKQTKFFLKKSTDIAKDQTYFLYQLNQRQLARVIFPLSEVTKNEARIIARKINLSVAEKGDSQDICFIKNSSQEFLGKKLKPQKGAILFSGKKIGDHQGIFNYTIGQRKGLGGGAKCPIYVTGIDSKKNIISVGTKDQLYSKELMANKLNLFPGVKLPLKCEAKIRYNMTPEPCIVKYSNLQNKEEFLVRFKSPQRAITPGQSVVFYKKDIILGGGIIKRSL